MNYPELIIFTQPNCPHCEAVKTDIALIKANFPNVTHIDLKPGPSKEADTKLASTFGVVATPSAVIIEDTTPITFILYEGENSFKENFLANAYQRAINKVPKPANPVPTNTTTKPNVPPISVDPGPVTSSDNKKPILIAAAIVALLLILK
ncbi:MAG: hypothetical protein IPO86_09915 [Saprospiraceae bacterium]|nr:hypothetical protein [Saprospiraceae bacterium]